MAGIFITYAYIFVQALVGFVYVPMLLHNIGQAEYGLYQLVGSVMSYIISINGILSAGVGRFYCKYKAEGNTELMESTLAIAKRIYWVLSVVVLIAIFILAFVIRAAYSNSLSSDQLDECVAMLIVLGVNTVVTMNNSINYSAITAYERFVFLKGSQLLSFAIQPFFVYFLTTVYHNALIVTIVVLATNVLCSLAQRIYAKRILKISYKYHGWDHKLSKGLLFFSGAIVLVTIADQIFWKTDQLIVGYFYGASAVAIYSVGAQIYTIYMTIGTAVSSVYLPRVSELYCKNKNMEAISELFVKVGRVSYIVCGFVLSVFAVLGKDFVALWAGEAYVDAYYIALIVMVPFTIDLIQNLGLTIMQVANVYLYRGYMYLSIALINIVATVALLNAIGLVGAAVSTALAMIVGNGICMNLYYQKKLGLDIKRFWLEMARISGILIPITTALLVIYRVLSSFIAGICLIVVSTAIYLIIYFVAMWIFALKPSEKSFIRQRFSAVLRSSN